MRGTVLFFLNLPAVIPPAQIRIVFEAFLGVCVVSTNGRLINALGVRDLLPGEAVDMNQEQRYLLPSRHFLDNAQDVR